MRIHILFFIFSNNTFKNNNFYKIYSSLTQILSTHITHIGADFWLVACPVASPPSLTSANGEIFLLCMRTLKHPHPTTFFTRLSLSLNRYLHILYICVYMHSRTGSTIVIVHLVVVNIYLFKHGF